jgi:hypothetical protein
LLPVFNAPAAPATQSTWPASGGSSGSGGAARVNATAAIATSPAAAGDTGQAVSRIVASLRAVFDEPVHVFVNMVQVVPQRLNVDGPSRLSSRADAVLTQTGVVDFGALAELPRSLLLPGEDALRRIDEVQRRLLQEASTHRTELAAALAATGGLSIGYVIWLIRGGVLASSMLSALPAWQLIDPLPILATVGAAGAARRRAEGEDDDVERLFDAPGGKEPAAAPDPALAAAPARLAATPTTGAVPEPDAMEVPR